MGMDIAGDESSTFADLTGERWKMAAVKIKSAKINRIANAICFISCQLVLVLFNLNYFGKKHSKQSHFPQKVGNQNSTY